MQVIFLTCSFIARGLKLKSVLFIVAGEGGGDGKGPATKDKNLFFRRKPKMGRDPLVRWGG